MAKDDMMDIVGIMQHHDAVTGTAKAHVAADYFRRMAASYTRNNGVYAQMVNEVCKVQAKLSSSSWEWCSRSNGTHLDCPQGRNKE